jgi:hypothetical protein
MAIKARPIDPTNITITTIRALAGIHIPIAITGIHTIALTGGIGRVAERRSDAIGSPQLFSSQNS